MRISVRTVVKNLMSMTVLQQTLAEHGRLGVVVLSNSAGRSYFVVPRFRRRDQPAGVV